MLSFVVTCVLAALSLAFGGFLLLWQFLAPSREPGGNGALADVVLLSVGALGALFVGTVFTLTVFVRAERWLATLPRTQVAFQRTPDLYRA